MFKTISPKLRKAKKTSKFCDAFFIFVRAIIEEKKLLRGLESNFKSSNEELGEQLKALMQEMKNLKEEIKTLKQK